MSCFWQRIPTAQLLTKSYQQREIRTLPTYIKFAVGSEMNTEGFMLLILWVSVWIDLDPIFMGSDLIREQNPAHNHNIVFESTGIISVYFG